MPPISCWVYQVYEVLLKMLDRWNAHDIEGHLEVYWKSPELLVVVDSEQFNVSVRQKQV
jgi:hypothetical protein